MADQATIILVVLINGILIAGVYALVATGLTLVFGVLRIVNFAHGEFVMLGSYFSYYLYLFLNISPIFSFFLVIPTMALLGLLLQKILINPILKAPVINQILLTFGLGLVLQNIAFLLFSAENVSVRTSYSSAPVNIGSISFGAARGVCFLIALAIFLLLYYVIKFTDFGKKLRAVEEDKEAAMLRGINSQWVYYVTFAIAASLGGISGVATSVVMYTFPMLGYLFILKAFCIVILGGLGSIMGAMYASLILGITESAVGYYTPGGSGWSEAVAFVLIVIVLIIKPKGIFGTE